MKQAVVDLTYGGLWMPAPVPIGLTSWNSAWVAGDGTMLHGVGLAEDDRLEDLWVAPQSQRLGIGTLLLQACERDIAERGVHLGHLQVVSTNDPAIRFYRRHGWTAQGVHPHPRFPITMVKMSKRLHV